ncbi:MAG TPA: hypothetical protein VIF83_14020 [Gemmatimonadaceae bacterium]
MKKIVSLSAAALLLAACSDATAPNATNTTPLDAKDSPPTITVTGNLTSDTYTFDDGTFSGSAGTTFTVEDLDGGFGASSPPIISAYNDAANKFIGRLDNHELDLIVPNGGSKYSVTFDLIIIGSWDGDGQQSGKEFGADLWSVGLACTPGGAIVQNLLTTTFSNQKTVQQSYPNVWRDGRGGATAGTGALSIDALGFRNDPTSHTPQFSSYGDTEYRLSFAGVNPCGAGSPLYVLFTVPNASLQSNYDESWGVDNLTIKTDS